MAWVVSHDTVRLDLLAGARLFGCIEGSLASILIGLFGVVRIHTQAVCELIASALATTSKKESTEKTNCSNHHDVHLRFAGPGKTTMNLPSGCRLFFTR